VILSSSDIALSWPYWNKYRQKSRLFLGFSHTTLLNSLICSIWLQTQPIAKQQCESDDCALGLYRSAWPLRLRLQSEACIYCPLWVRTRALFGCLPRTRTSPTARKSLFHRVTRWLSFCLGYLFDRTLGYPGEGPQEHDKENLRVKMRVHVCVLRVFVCGHISGLLQVSQMIAILREFRSRKLGTGEPVYVESLANKLEFSFESTRVCLEQIGLKLAKHGRWLAVTVPADDVLDSKLAQMGQNISVGQPLCARVNGSFRNIKSFQSCEQCSDGRWRFSVEWNSLAPSVVYCTDLNAAARAHVRWCEFLS
jgi:hypothetical protein